MEKHKLAKKINSDIYRIFLHININKSDERERTSTDRALK